MAFSTSRPVANTISVVDENGNVVFKPIADVVPASGPETIQFITDYDMLYDGSTGSSDFYLPLWNVGSRKIFFRTLKPNADPGDDAIYLLWGYTGGSSISVYGFRNGVIVKSGMTSSPSTTNVNHVIGNAGTNLLTNNTTYVVDVFFVCDGSHAAAKYNIILIAKNGVLNGFATQIMMQDM
jgi:hypothetical protein